MEWLFLLAVVAVAPHCIMLYRCTAGDWSKEEQVEWWNEKL